MNADRSKIICPYCSIEFLDSHLFDDDNGMDIECDNCGKTFYLYVAIMAEYTTERDCNLNDEEHDWQAVLNITSATRVWYSCSKCDATKVEDKE
jgi:DNA-directed RNA polymerase subunit RPC12/RpoP